MLIGCSLCLYRDEMLLNLLIGMNGMVGIVGMVGTVGDENLPIENPDWKVEFGIP